MLRCYNLKSIIYSRSSILSVVKHSCLIFLITSFSNIAAQRTGLVFNTGLSATYSDNVLNNLNQESDVILSLTPQASFLSLIGKHKFAVSYKGVLAQYSDNSSLNYNEHRLAMGAILDHSQKFNSEFKLGFDKIIEEPGTTNAETNSLVDFIKFNNKRADAKFYYGKKNSIGQIMLGYRYIDREYDNVNQAFRDFSLHDFSATFFYRLAPRTRLLVALSSGDFNYGDLQLNNGLVFNQSSELKLYLAGIEWEASAKTKGTFRIGYQNKDFNDTRLNDISGLSYNLDLTWKPNTYTQIQATAARQTSESAQLNQGGFLSQSYSVSIIHKLLARTSLNAKLAIDDDDIVFSASNSNRNDKRNVVELGIKHSLKKWLNVELQYKYQEKSSNIELFNFDANNISLTFETVFK